jgi:hypothetical protein
MGEEYINIVMIFEDNNNNEDDEHIMGNGIENNFIKDNVEEIKNEDEDDVGDEIENDEVEIMILRRREKIMLRIIILRVMILRIMI